MFSLRRIAHNVVDAARSSGRAKHTLPKLPYDYKALEPIISGEIMEMHHTKHHQAYINNLNAAEDELQDAVTSGNILKIMTLSATLRFNGGGHLNHDIFWKNLTPTKTEPSRELLNSIKKQFCSLDNLKKEMTAATVGIHGSGWGWLGFNRERRMLQIITMPNQDALQATTGVVPLFGIDVWEHAYYLQYKNLRASYVQAIWDLANWEDISCRFTMATL